MRFVERYRKVAELPEPLLQPLRLKNVLEGVERLLAPALDQGHVDYARLFRRQTLRCGQMRICWSRHSSICCATPPKQSTAIRGAHRGGLRH